MSTPLVLFHGSLGRGRDWDALTGALGRAEVHAPDLPGHGARYDAPPADWDAAVATLAAEVEDGADLVGYSLGGRLAIGVARELRGRLRSLVLESAHPGLDAGERAARAAADDAAAGRLAEDPAAFLDAFWGAPLFASFRAHPGFAAERERRLARVRRDAARAAATWRALSPGRMPDLWPALAELDLPVLFVSGSLDEKYTAVGARVAEVAPRGVHAVVEDAGHNVHFERPDAFARALDAFWRSLA